MNDTTRWQYLPGLNRRLDHAHLWRELLTSWRQFTLSTRLPKRTVELRCDACLNVSSCKWVFSQIRRWNRQFSAQEDAILFTNIDNNICYVVTQYRAKKTTYRANTKAVNISTSTTVTVEQVRVRVIAEPILCRPSTTHNDYYPTTTRVCTPADRCLVWCNYSSAAVACHAGFR